MQEKQIQGKQVQEKQGEKILELKNLHISFTQYTRGLSRRTIESVRGLSFSTYEGEVTALVGESGSGKSLLAHAVMGLLPYNASVSGEIYYCGELLEQKQIEILRGREIVLVPQGASYLDPLMKAGPQILKGKADAERKEKLRAILERYHLKESTTALYPFELSGGMSRRVLIASATIEEPKLVIADEPTPGLEKKTAKMVMGHFRELAEMGSSVLVITHDLELAIETADRILVMQGGRVVEATSPEAFREERTLCHPYTKALWKAMPSHGFIDVSEKELFLEGEVQS